MFRLWCEKVALVIKEKNTSAKHAQVKCLVQVLVVFTLDHLYDVFSVFGPSVQMKMKTTSVCRTFLHMMGHTYGVVQMLMFTQIYFFLFYYFVF